MTRFEPQILDSEVTALPTGPLLKTYSSANDNAIIIVLKC